MLHFSKNGRFGGIPVSQIHLVFLSDVINKYKKKISEMEKDIEEIELLEKEEKIMRATENQVNHAKRVLEEKKAQEPERVWFQSHKERMEEKGIHSVKWASVCA